jgi:hypothetical protein
MVHASSLYGAAALYPAANARMHATGHICLDKQVLLWSIGKLINFNRGPDYEKDIDEFQQHQDEANPWFSRPDGHKRRQGRP